ncbi:hypothetical protein BFO01nite_04980 [Brevibacillus formosus]|uniref:Uncharacterized protein n=1 Tax=Brevibacillus formosus TaxID=54913 RepID=A0ABQ0SZ50_9BACL|nr:hypothetical protein BFO01nite_04980 [Brevibacillus formosus]
MVTSNSSNCSPTTTPPLSFLFVYESSSLDENEIHYHNVIVMENGGGFNIEEKIKKARY